MRQKTILLVSGSLVVGLPSVAFAQERSDAPGSGNDLGNEIVVTANKREESLLEVPISIVALSDDALRESGVKNMADIAQLVPGVQFDQSAGFGSGTQTYVSIRGVNSTIGQSTTGVYLDDTPLQTRVAALSYFGNPYPVLFDLERVEVLRGPQGTLFGAGALGGAVRFITPSPSLYGVEGTARAEVGFIDGGGVNYEAGAAVGAPIVEGKIGVRASLWGRRDGGYVDRINPFTGDVIKENTNSAESYAGRFSAAFAPSENVTITPSVYYQDVENHDAPLFYLTSPHPADGNVDENIADPEEGEFFNGRLLRQPYRDKWVMPSLNIEAEVRGLTLTSVTSYLDRKGTLASDTTNINCFFFGSFDEEFEFTPGCGNPLGLEYPTGYDQAGPQEIRTELETVSQEIRLTNGGSGAIGWTAGVFYMHSEQFDYQAARSPWTVENFINPLGYAQDLDDPILFSQILSTDEQYSAFGQLDWALTDRLTLTVGARLSHHIASYEQDQSGFLSAAEEWGPVVSDSDSQSETPWSGKVGLDYQITPDIMLFGSASRGYRIGGPNQPISSVCGVDVPPSYGSDTVDSYEVGAKGRAAGGSLQFNVDAFLVNWKNIQQVIFFPCAFGYIDNTGDAEIRGFDVSLSYRVTDSVILSGSVTHTDATYAKNVFLPGTDGTQTGEVVVRAGDQLNPNAAPWNLVGSIDYFFDIGGVEGMFRLEDIYRSRNTGSFSYEDPNAVLYDPLQINNPSVNQLNARLAVYLNNLEIAVFAQNLLNDHPILFRYRDDPSATLVTGNTITPRTIGLSLDYNF